MAARLPNWAEWFFSLPAELMTALATVIGFALLGDLTPGQQNSLGNFLMLISQVMETNATQAQLLQSDAQSRQLDDMQRAIDELREEVERLRRSTQQPPQ